MKSIPWWAVASATTAPVVLGSGWTIAAALQPKQYSAVRDTISALAARGAHDRWVMSSALVGLGACHIITALGLHPAKKVARSVLGLGGVATILVAAFPQPESGNSVAHTVVAGIAFTSLGLWPLFTTTSSPISRLFSRTAAIPASVVMVGLSAWFAFDSSNAFRGLIERSAAGSQALWPLVIVLASHRVLAESLAIRPTVVTP